jgi:hypothetical protein
MIAEGEIIRRFLESPLDRRRFDAFFQLCYSCTLGFLRYYRSRGYPLPVERANPDLAVSDLALTLLGELFQSENGRPFFPVFEYFERHGMADHDAVSETMLCQHFKILLGGYLKKRLFQLRKSDQHQSETLKRRIKDILQLPDYVRFDDDSTGQISVAMAVHRNNLRSDKQPIQWKTLQETVNRAYTASSSRVNWCHNIFSDLNNNESVQNYLRMNLLLESMVTINEGALQEFCPKPAAPLPPDLGGIKCTVREAVDEAVAWAKKEVLVEFVASGRVSSDDAKLYLLAVERYLLDLGNCGEADRLPVYFREVMPEGRHSEYLDRHRYPFKTVISRSADYFRSRLAEEIP